MTASRLLPELEDILPRLARLEAPTLARATEAVLDTIGCMLAGADHPTVASLVAARGDLGLHEGTHGASLIGREERADEGGAAFINGTAAHVLDFDDNFLPGLSHASAVLVPALLAVAEARGASGRALLEAYVFGLDVQRAIGRAINPRHYTLGWHGTSTVGAFGAAAAVARLRGADAAGVMRALSIAASLVGGSKRQFGSPMKPVHAGLAARNGVFAAALAAAGLHGAEEPFEGSWGLFDLFTASRGDVPPPEPVIFRGHAIDIEGVVAKLWPCCGSAHRSLDGLLALRRTHGFEARDVAHVVLEMPQLNIDNLRFRVPTTANEARFSMHYTAAIALASGAVEVGHFPEPFRMDAEVRALIDRIDVIACPAHPTPDDPFGALAVTRVDTTSGRTHEIATAHMKGGLENPMTPEERLAKFMSCARARLSEIAAQEARAAIEGLARAPRAEDVVRALVPAPLVTMREARR